VVDDLSSGLPLGDWPRFFGQVACSPHLSFHQSDVRGYMSKADPDFDLIVHLAAVVGGRLTIDGDPLRVATDLAIDADFFNWIVRGGHERKQVVYFSSSAAYPVDRQAELGGVSLGEWMVDLRSGRIGKPDMTYGWAKLTGAYLALHAMERYGLQVAIYRPFSGYGEDQDPTYPFTAILQRALNRECPLVVWGSGQQVRDFIHIEDIVDAVLATHEGLTAETPLNLGSGIGTSMLELAHKAQDAVGYDAVIVADTSKPEGVVHRVCDSTELLSRFSPTIDLDEGIARTLDYLAERATDERCVHAELGARAVPHA
jgi:UDP-glucose 4-epimerase